MRPRIAAVVALLAASEAAAQPQHAGVFATDGGDVYAHGEIACLARWRTKTEVRGWPNPTTTAGRPIRTVAPDRLVEHNDRSAALTVTLRPGRAVARADLSFQARDLGPVRYLAQDGPVGEREVTLRLRRGEAVELLQHWEVEGYASGYFRRDGRVYLYEGGGLEADFEIEREPETRLWVRLVPAGAGRPAAWVLVSDEDEFEELTCEEG